MNVLSVPDRLGGGQFEQGTTSSGGNSPNRPSPGHAKRVAYAFIIEDSPDLVLSANGIVQSGMKF